MLGLPDHFVLFDTEFTAWEGSMERGWKGPNEHREIIQIGALKVHGADLSEEDVFSRYVKPRINPRLSEYIIALTGITQEKINDEGVPFEIALEDFNRWSRELPLWSHGNDLPVMKENCM